MFFNYLFIILGVNIVILIGIILIVIGRHSKVFNDKEFEVSIKNLELIINCYKHSILIPIKVKMEKNYDLDYTSQTNAIKKFQQEERNLITIATKKILNDYISLSLRKSLMKYFNIDSLTLFVLTKLKG